MTGRRLTALCALAAVLVVAAVDRPAAEPPVGKPQVNACADRLDVPVVGIGKNDARDLRHVAIGKCAQIVTAEVGRNQNVWRQNAGVVQRRMKFISGALARSRHRSGVAKPVAGSVVRAGPRKRRHPRLDGRPGRRPIAPTLIEDHGQRSGAQAVQIESAIPSRRPKAGVSIAIVAVGRTRAGLRGEKQAGYQSKTASSHFCIAYCNQATDIVS